MKDGTVVTLKEDLVNINIEGLASYSIMTQAELDKRVGIYAHAGDVFTYEKEYDIFRGPGGNELRLDESWYILC